MKCLQNYVESCDGDIETCEKSTKKKTKVHHDYVPVTFFLKIDLPSPKKPRKNKRIVAFTSSIY